MTAIPSWNVIDEANRLMSSLSLSTCDALLIAACLEHGVTKLFSEDFGGCPPIGGLLVENPFRPRP